jgi:hypothetical protein
MQLLDGQNSSVLDWRRRTTNCPILGGPGGASLQSGNHQVWCHFGPCEL